MSRRLAIMRQIVNLKKGGPIRPAWKATIAALKNKGEGVPFDRRVPAKDLSMEEASLVDRAAIIEPMAPVEADALQVQAPNPEPIHYVNVAETTADSVEAAPEEPKPKKKKTYKKKKKVEDAEEKPEGN